MALDPPDGDKIEAKMSGLEGGGEGCNGRPEKKKKSVPTEVKRTSKIIPLRVDRGGEGDTEGPKKPSRHDGGAGDKLRENPAKTARPAKPREAPPKSKRGKEWGKR